MVKSRSERSGQILVERASGIFKVPEEESFALPANDAEALSDAPAELGFPCLPTSGTQVYDRHGSCSIRAIEDKLERFRRLGRNR